MNLTNITNPINRCSVSYAVFVLLLCLLAGCSTSQFSVTATVRAPWSRNGEEATGRELKLNESVDITFPYSISVHEAFSGGGQDSRDDTVWRSSNEPPFEGKKTIYLKLIPGKILEITYDDGLDRVIRYYKLVRTEPDNDIQRLQYFEEKRFPVSNLDDRVKKTMRQTRMARR
jgi:hypothetical protein